MSRIATTIAATAAALSAIALVPTSAGATDADAAARPSVYQLPGDPVEQGGSKFEGIGLDPRNGDFYVSEVTGGEISRGNVLTPSARPWLGGNGTDGRYTARGVTVDQQGRVYVAGGPNAIGNPARPDLWVYAPDGRLLAALDTGVDGAFLNDVAIGGDGAAYFTNSNAPQVFRVALTGAGWTVETFVDATGTIPVQIGPNQFNLGGIVSTPDGSALLVANGVTGTLWRIGLADKAVSQIPVPGANLVNADGLVLRGERLWVVRNFARTLVTIDLDDQWSSATLVSEVATDASRVLTTAKLFGGRLLAVDSHFDENPAGLPPYEVITIPVG